MTAAQKALSIIVPVYCNETSLPELFAQFQNFERELANHNVRLDLIFVDDGSGDNSLQALLCFKQERSAIKVVCLARNFGSAVASKTGFLAATGDAFVVVAASRVSTASQRST
jgi:polyisoprenyl-phosphate glycosyltransferase